METGFKASRIISIGTAAPGYSSNQDTILNFMNQAYQEPDVFRKLRILFNRSGIDKRHSAIPDFSDSGQRTLFQGSKELPMLTERMDIFKQEALPLAISAVENAFGSLGTPVGQFGITHLITVSCTGMHSPGIDAEIMSQLNLSPDIFHISLNFMGCNAAFPALRIADSMIRSDAGARVLIVCVELCTLHFQPKNNSDNLLSNTIFGDGAAAAVLVSESTAAAKELKGFTLTGFYPMLLSRGHDLMGWYITPVNFEMILDAAVPEFLGDELVQFMGMAADKLPLGKVIHHWAIHPGGRKILETIQRELQLENNELAYSWEVLRNYGNMSSPTVLFVLSDIFKSNPVSGETVFAMSFGPGISIETASMICHDFL